MRKTLPGALRVAQPWLMACATTADTKAALWRILASVDVRHSLFPTGADSGRQVAGVALIARTVEMVSAPVKAAQSNARKWQEDAKADAEAMRTMGKRWPPLEAELTAQAAKLEAWANGLGALPQFGRIRAGRVCADKARQERAAAVDLHTYAMNAAGNPMHEAIAALLRAAFDDDEISADRVRHWVEAETRRLRRNRQ